MSAPELSAGHIVAGRYAVQSLLGHGGAMATYHAITAPNRQVALKLYDPAVLSRPDLLTMLEQHRTLASSLASRSIAAISESGDDPGTGSHFTVTDLEPHPSLADLVSLCPLSTAEMLTLMGNLARAVDLLLSNGIVHLALHPHNVFVGPAPTFEVRVVDFGSGAVRKALRSRERLERRAPWLAPEQLDEGQAWDAKTDVFAAALVALFATGGQSYWRSCPRGAIDVDAWKRELSGPRMPASRRAEELGCALPPAFDAVFARALAVSPRDRFGSVGELAAALAGAAGGVETASGDIPPPPAQMEAVLDAFEKGAPEEPANRVGSLLAETLADEDSGVQDIDLLADSGDFTHAQPIVEPPSEASIRPAMRRRVVYAAGALLLSVGGAIALFGSARTSRTRWGDDRGAQAVASGPVVAVEPPSPIPPPAAVPLPDPPSEAEDAPTSSAATSPTSAPRAVVPAPAPAPARRPVAPRPPAKKPCGKFLKRCT